MGGALSLFSLSLSLLSLSLLRRVMAGTEGLDRWAAVSV